MLKEKKELNERLLKRLAVEEKKEKWAKKKDIAFEHLSKIIEVILELHK